MHVISRRGIIGVGALTAGLLSSPLLRRSARAATVTRYDLTSTDGQAMLKIYADAVGKMMALKEGDPRGWLFQWYTHAVRNDRTKAAEISRIYGANPGADGQLASDAWDTCEAHTDPSHEDFFLPWHRMYVLCLEQIVRKITGRDDFTLPYWNYTDKSQRALPAEFLKKNDPVWGPLYRSTRYSDVNKGKPIDQIPGSEKFDLSAMKSGTYSGTSGDAGFCSNLDQNPHGHIHDDVGNGQGMASIPWAANDPIFWMHHCNIDRIWASWNKAGGKNASLTGTYTFADQDGKKVQLDVANFLDTIPLGYQYDNYLSRPAGGLPFPTDNKFVAFALHAGSQSSSGPVKLGAATATVTLVPAQAAGAPALNVNQFAASLKALPADRQFILRLEDVRASTAPGVGYDIYYGLAQGQKPDRDNPAFVGSLSFFGAVPHAGHAMPGMPGMANMPGRTYSFVITQPVQQALSGPANAAAAKVTLVPTGKPREGSAPTIGNIALLSA